jgi:CHAT domain-containing protein
MFLPLHAAGDYDVGKEDCCSDYVVSSYAPTLSALLRAQKSVQSFSKRDAKLALVAAMTTQHINLPTLWNINDEIDCVRAAAEGAKIAIDEDCVDRKAVVENVAEAFTNANLAHIACHGIQNVEHALSSGFCLVDGNLTVSRLMELDLKNAFFAFLSACETAKGDEKQPDQTVHLAATMMFIGFRSVVATMWSVHRQRCMGS